jgi:uncharacterized protein YdaU (DUF1376 family)
MAYLRLIWFYYDTEKPLPKDADKLAFMLGASSQDTRLILEHFFVEEPNCYRHKRCDAEIEAYRNRQDHGRKAAKARWENAQSMPAASIEHTRSKKNDANREPITDNREPIKKITTTRPEGVSEEVWDSFVAQRRKTRAVVTDLVIRSIKKEAQKVGWSLEQALTEITARGWRGFKADWVKDKTFKNQGERNREVLSGLTRGLIGGDNNVGLLGN